MEEYSTLAYTTLPLGGWGKVECLMLGSGHRGLTNILYKIPPAFISKEAQLINTSKSIHKVS